jgi:hypothetical protein
MKIIEDLVEELYEKIGDEECSITSDENVISIYLDLPDTENYTVFLDKVERFMVKSKYDIEDFEIDGDYEGQIDIVYEGDEE